MGSDNFCLRWNDFESNVSTSFRELREEKDLFDVTLVTDSEKEFKAHKVILSACSSFFKGILRRLGSPSPLIYLRGIGASDLAAILDFMYNGEVNVAQEELNSFLSVAEDLRIKGLTQKSSGSENASAGGEDGGERKMGSKSKLLPSHHHHQSSGAPSSPSSSKKFRRIAPKSGEDGSAKDILDVKSEPSIAAVAEASGTDFDDGADVSASYDDAYGDESAYFDDAGMMGLDDVPPDASHDNSKGVDSSFFKNMIGGSSEERDEMDELDRIILSQMTKVDRFWSCDTCGLQSRDKTDMRRHVEARHIDTNGFPCDQCTYVSKTRYNLVKHIRRKHQKKDDGPPASETTAAASSSSMVSFLS